MVVRLFNTYGPGEWYHPYRSVNCKFVYHALKGLPVVVSGAYPYVNIVSGGQLSDHCEHRRELHRWETYNIGGRDHHDIETLADLVWECANADRDLISYQDSES